MKKLPDCTELHTIAFDFDGVFTDNKVLVNERGEESITCDRSDGLGMEMLRKYFRDRKSDVNIFIISKERNKVVKARSDKLKCKFHQGIDDKRTFMEEYLKEIRANRSELKAKMIYVCNDLNDLPVATLGCFVVVPIDAHNMIKKIADVIIDKQGGNGFVRKFIEMLIGLDQLPIDEVSSLMQK